jgi:hypothetical protein
VARRQPELGQVPEEVDEPALLLQAEVVHQPVTDLESISFGRHLRTKDNKANKVNARKYLSFERQ